MKPRTNTPVSLYALLYEQDLSATVAAAVTKGLETTNSTDEKKKQEETQKEIKNYLKNLQQDKRETPTNAVSTTGATQGTQGKSATPAGITSSTKAGGSSPVDPKSVGAMGKAIGDNVVNQLKTLAQKNRAVAGAPLKKIFGLGTK